MNDQSRGLEDLDEIREMAQTIKWHIRNVLRGGLFAHFFEEKGGFNHLRIGAFRQ
jgi:hypothetical protein